MHAHMYTHTHTHTQTYTHTYKHTHNTHICNTHTSQYINTHSTRYWLSLLGLALCISCKLSLLCFFVFDIVQRSVEKLLIFLPCKMLACSCVNCCDIRCASIRLQNFEHISLSSSNNLVYFAEPTSLHTLFSSSESARIPHTKQKGHPQLRHCVVEVTDLTKFENSQTITAVMCARV